MITSPIFRYISCLEFGLLIVRLINTFLPIAHSLTFSAIPGKGLLYKKGSRFYEMFPKRGILLHLSYRIWGFFHFKRPVQQGFE